MPESTEELRPLPILFEDSGLIAVHKPPGMFVHRSDADRTDTCVVVQTLRDQIGQFVYPLHRLDRATSGVLLMALTPELASQLGQMFADRRISKTYQALVRGFCDESGRIEHALTSVKGRRKKDRPSRGVVQEPAVTQEAVTEYRCLKHFEVPLPSGRYPTTRASLLEVNPLTGRYHQIRRHCNHISHPVIGDTSHGDGRQNEFFRDQFAVTRLMLIAVRLQFVHPTTGEICDIHCPPDPTFAQVTDLLQPFAIDPDAAQSNLLSQPDV